MFEQFIRLVCLKTQKVWLISKRALIILKKKKLKKNIKMIFFLSVANLLLLVFLITTSITAHKLTDVHKENRELQKKIEKLRIENDRTHRELEIMRIEHQQPNRAYGEKVKDSLKREKLNNYLVLQTDERWKDTPYGWGAHPTLETNGCVIAALTIVDATLSRKEKAPKSIITWAGNKYFTDNGTSWEIYKDFAAYRGYDYKKLGNDIDKAIPYLEKNNPIIAVAHPGYFTTLGHALVLTHYDEKGIRLLDPSDNNSKKHSLKYYSKNMLTEEFDNYWVFEERTSNFKRE